MNSFLLSKYRTELMGVATIMILLCHASATWTTMPYLLKRLLGIGNLGVDLFLLVSGVGIAFSLSRISSLREIKYWYKKRFLRIIVPYTMIMIPTLLYLKIRSNHSWMDLLLHYSTIDFWTNHRGAWYIAMILPLYVVSPFIFRFINRFSNTCLVGIAISLFLFIFSIFHFSGSSTAINILKNIQYCCLRIPAFICGMSLFPLIKDHKDISTRKLIRIFLVCFVLIAILRVLGKEYEFPLLQLIPLVIILLLLINKVKSKLRLLLFMGSISLESYLTNVYLPLPIKDCNHLILNDRLPDYLVYFIIVLLGISISILVHKMSNIVLSKKSYDN